MKNIFKIIISLIALAFIPFSLAKAQTVTLPPVYTTGDIIYASATKVLSKLGIGSLGQCLQVSGGLPAWLDCLTTESGIEAVVDLQDLQGAVTDSQVPDNITINTAGALSANGANCSAGNAPLGVDASGAVESCTDFEEDLSNSAGLAGALSDETGFTTGALSVFSINPTITGALFDGDIELDGDGVFNIDDTGILRFSENDINGSNFKAFTAPASITTSTTCIFEDDANFIPDSCVGDGTDGGVTGSGTENELAYWSASDQLFTLTTAVYPSLTEISRVKGVTSAIQTQLNAKQAQDFLLDDIADLTDPNADRIMFWDDSAGIVQWLTLGTGLSITDTTISSTGGGVPTQITVADETEDTTSFPLFVSDATGDLQPKTNSSYTFNAESGLLTVPRFSITSSNFTIGSSLPFSDSAGTLTLQNVDVIDATTETTLESTIDIAGDVSGTGLGSVVIGADKVLESMLKAVDTASDEECLTYESTGGDFEWQSCGSGGSGDIESVGDVTSGPAFDGTAGTILTFNDTDGDRTIEYDNTNNQFEVNSSWLPASNDGGALGSATQSWADLFLATGSVLNFANGNYTLTHSSGLLTASGPFSIGTSNALTAGSIELGNASDTTLARNSAGQLNIEGVQALTASNTVTVTNKTIASASNVLDSCIKQTITDDFSNLTTGTAKKTFRMPFAMTVTSVRGSLVTAGTGATLVTVDINESGSTILSTKITFDASEKTSLTAVTAPVISDTALADDAEITVDIDAVGNTTPGNGLEIQICGTI